jgi:hypothetical protein
VNESSLWTILSVYSMDGREILNYELKPSVGKTEFFISMKDFTSGIYFVKINGGAPFSSMQKIVKE